MSWYKMGKESEKWKDNQGFINAKVERLYFSNEDIKGYTDSLTKEQRDKARSHLLTVIKLRAK